MVHFIVLCS